MLQLEKINTILNVIPYVGRGERSAKDLEMALVREGFKPSARSIRRYLAYLCDVNEITEVRCEGKRKYFARIEPNGTAMSYEQAMVLSKVRHCIAELFPTAVNDSLDDWFKQADTTIAKLTQLHPTHPLLKYAEATQAINVKAFFSAHANPVTNLAAANDALYHDKELKLALCDSEYERHMRPSALSHYNGVTYLEGNYVDNPGQEAHIPLSTIKSADCVDYTAFGIEGSPSRRV
jgi:predicted DNA-binding transcriptional regulator YafY